MLALLFVSKAYTLLVLILESTNTRGTMCIETREKVPHWILVTFPKHTVPFLKDANACKVIREGEKTYVLFYSKSPAKLRIKYEKVLQKIQNLDYKIERGLKFDPVALMKRGNVFFSQSVTDIFPVPDFSAPFISFSTWGVIFGLIFNLFINQP
eukprot:jgi/Antlo1/229/1511